MRSLARLPRNAQSRTASHRVAAGIVAGLLIGLLAGCAPTVALEPADDAVNPACAEVIVRLPDTVAELPRRSTNAQATGAWGEPTAVILRCGVPVPAPTAALACVTVDGVDWLRDDSNDPSFVFTTYGRNPAIEVIIDSNTVSGFGALNDLARAVSQLPIEGKCLSPDQAEQPLGE
ncbi:MAG: DUF3515 domain-containing protein [Salinibacterium sp.]|nr:DUF3515 domain-containing protein [Salinibacterium sp.]